MSQVQIGLVFPDVPNPIVLQESLRGLLYRKAGVHGGKMRARILYADFVLRESARQV